MTGIERITSALGDGGRGRGPALMAHAVCGWPDLPTSARIFAALARGGAGLIEAQLPFSDPSADRPAIVEANCTALAAGTTTESSLALLGELRRTTGLPILVMSYLNPLLAYGLDRLLGRMVDLGLDGLIIPDWPDDEPELCLAEKCQTLGLALVPLIAPTTDLARAGKLARASNSPFVYAILRLGVTGRETAIDTPAQERLRALQKATGLKVAAGFGLRQRAQVTALAGSADCAIVGSALLGAAKAALLEGRDPAKAVRDLVAELAG